MNETGLSVAVAGRSEARLAEVESDQSKRLVVDVTNLQQLLGVRVYDREVSFDNSIDRALGLYSIVIENAPRLKFVREGVW